MVGVYLQLQAIKEEVKYTFASSNSPRKRRGNKSGKIKLQENEMVDKGGNGMTFKRLSLVQTILYLIFCDKNVSQRL